jgi:RNA recognition motif-containing protein
MQLSVKTLYIAGIEEPINDNDLKDYFSQYGHIIDTIIMKDCDGQCRG